MPAQSWNETKIIRKWNEMQLSRYENCKQFQSNRIHTSAQKTVGHHTKANIYRPFIFKLGVAALYIARLQAGDQASRRAVHEWVTSKPHAPAKLKSIYMLQVPQPGGRAEGTCNYELIEYQKAMGRARVRPQKVADGEENKLMKIYICWCVQIAA